MHSFRSMVETTEKLKQKSGNIPRGGDIWTVSRPGEGRIWTKIFQINALGGCPGGGMLKLRFDWYISSRWRLHTGLCKFVQKISRNVWSLGKHRDPKLGDVSLLPVSYNITISRLYLLKSFQLISFITRQWKTNRNSNLISTFRKGLLGLLVDISAVTWLTLSTDTNISWRMGWYSSITHWHCWHATDCQLIY